MALLFTLATPVQVGDLNNQITVSSLKLISFSFNFEDEYANAGVAVLSIRLVDPVSGFPVNIVFQDKASLTMANTLETNYGQALFNKLIASGKLPAGTLSTV
jgi:hypothetical protein